MLPFLSAFLLVPLAVEGVSPEELLWRACKEGDVEEVQRLIEAGADLDARTEFEATAVYFAAANDHPEVCAILADAGAELDVADNFYGNTPVGMAGWLGYGNCVRVLLEKGSNQGIGALFAAASNNHLEAVQAVVESIEVPQGVLDSAAQQAAGSGYAELVDFLVSAGANAPPPAAVEEAEASAPARGPKKPDDPYTPVSEPQPWPRFRGPDGAGIADGQHPPLTWDVSQDEHVRWRVPVTGLGHSSPVIWGNRLFLTTAVGEKPNTGTFQGDRGWIGAAKEDFKHRYEVHAYNLSDGELLWKTVCHEGVPSAERHWKASHANCTVAVDGDRVVALFGSEGLYCLDLEGELLWQKDLGDLDAGWFVDDSFGWGYASSPVIWEDRVIVQCDVSGPDYVAAFDLESGRELWRAERDELPAWGTPVVGDGPEGPEVVLNATNAIQSYDPASGELLWSLSGNSKITVSSPVVFEGLVFVSGGYQRPDPIYAVALGSQGDLTPGEGEPADGLIWSKNRGGVYQPTPIVYGGLLYMLKGNGVMSCYEASTGEELYRERVITGGSAHTASPVAADGYLYLTAESGEVYVVRAGEEFELVAVNDVGGRTLTTPAISNGMLVFRTVDELVAIAHR